MSEEIKVVNIEKIAENLNCKNIIPFASFIHFSNESNFFNISNVTYTAINIDPPTNSYFNSSTYYLPKKEF